MSPYEYLLKYRNLTVNQVTGGPVTVDIHEYRNAQDVFDKRNTDNDPTNDVDNMREDFDAGAGWKDGWGPLRSKIARHGKKLGPNLYSLQFPLPTKANPTPVITSTETANTAQLASVFTGKGSPENIAQALRLALAFGLVTTGGLQKYCDDYIGLDCNGYVGNYLVSEGCTIVGPSTPANAYAFVKEPYRVSTLEDVKYQSVLTWKNTGHVAIVDFNFGPVYVPPKYDTYIIRCMVCESTGARLVPGDIHTDGLNYTLYEIHPPQSGKVFRVKRGIGGSGLNEVYIGNLM